jgi:A predicted alpha-helical domain with a conserved ER motif.
VLSTLTSGVRLTENGESFRKTAATHAPPFPSSADVARRLRAPGFLRRNVHRIRFNIGELQASLQAISRATPGTYATEAERLTGKLHETLLYDPMQDIFERGLHVFLRNLQRTCRSIGEHIARKYFYYAVA